jgi:hypothetical protein
MVVIHFESRFIQRAIFMKLKTFSFAALFALLPACIVAQNCTAVLKQTSNQYIDATSEKNGGSTLARIAAIQAYQACYHERIIQLKNKLDQGKGPFPMMGARGDFGDMENALTALTTYALKITATGGTYDSVKAAYAKLYALAFEKVFYESYMVSKQKAIDPMQLDKAQNSLHAELLNYTQDEQIQFQMYFDQFVSSLKMVQGFQASSYPAYQYALWILQSPASSTLINPVF